MSSTDNSAWLDFEFSVPKNLDIECVARIFAQLLNLILGLCVDNGTLLRKHMPRACVTGKSPSQRGGQSTSGRLNCH